MTRPFRTWAGDVTTTPRAWRRPACAEEVAEAVRSAVARGGRVHAVGSRHSWSAIAADDDVLLDLDDLDAVASVDPEACTVTVGAGMRLRELVGVLAGLGLGLPVAGSILEQTLAGATATGTHGSSLVHGNLSSLVRSARLIDGAGEARILDGATWRGARVHLGALGVLTELTVDVAPRWALRERRTRVPVDELSARLPELARAHEWVKVWWLPHTPHAVVFAYDRLDGPAPDRSPVADALDRIANAALFPALLALGGAAPGLIPWHNRLVDRVHFAEGVRDGWLADVLPLTMPPRHRETEWSVPLGAAGGLFDALRGWIDAHGARVDFIVELRFVPADEAWASPAHGRDSCHLGVYAARTPDLRRVFDAFAALALERGGRPHWGKSFDLAPGQVAALYPELDRLRALADELDPRGVFRNPFLRRVLG